MIGVGAEHVALACAPQRHLDIAGAVDGVGRNPAEGHGAAIARSIIANASFGLVANLTVSGTCAAANARDRRSRPWANTGRD